MDGFISVRQEEVRYITLHDEQTSDLALTDEKMEIEYHDIDLL